jgi:hypothetical protein
MKAHGIDLKSIELNSIIMHTGISLGWNCESAMKGVSLGIRATKKDGYKTCPFDECITNYEGLLLCLKEDFLYFCDPMYLKIIEAPHPTPTIHIGDRLLCNTRYNFIFNHESPGHANLYLKQEWAGGQDHYIDNNFALFIERYNRRIENFRNYLSGSVTFIIGNYEDDVNELESLLKEKYPSLVYDMFHYEPDVSIGEIEEIYRLIKNSV